MPFVSPCYISMLVLKTATLAFLTCLTEVSDALVTTTPRITLESEVPPPKIF